MAALDEAEFSGRAEQDSWYALTLPGWRCALPGWRWEFMDQLVVCMSCEEVCMVQLEVCMSCVEVCIAWLIVGVHGRARCVHVLVGSWPGQRYTGPGWEWIKDGCEVCSASLCCPVFSCSQEFSYFYLSLISTAPIPSFFSLFYCSFFSVCMYRNLRLAVTALLLHCCGSSWLVIFCVNISSSAAAKNWIRRGCEPHCDSLFCSLFTFYTSTLNLISIFTLFNGRGQEEN